LWASETEPRLLLGFSPNETNDGLATEAEAGAKLDSAELALSEQAINGRRMQL